MSLIIPANTLASGGYEVDNSLRFNDGSSDFLSKTFSSAGKQQKMTISFWIKRSDLSGTKEVISQGSGSACHMNFPSSGILEMNLRNSVDGGSNVLLVTNRLFRDVSAWYHIVLALDTTQGTAANRAKLYVNGVQETSFGTENYPSQNGNLFFNEASAMQIGEDTGGANFNYDGYMAEFVFINAEQLDPTSFGEFDEDSGIWKPIDVSGLTFGTNGFYLVFEDSSALGNDVAGSNNFTVNNLTAIDQSTDTCTNNFATLNSLANGLTMSEGNLSVAGASDNNTGATIGVQSGKWYWEVKDIAAKSSFGIANSANRIGTSNQSSAAGMYLIQSTGSGTWYKYTSGSFGTTSVSVHSANDILNFALDADNGKLYIGINGSYINSSNTSANPATNSNPFFSSISTDEFLLPFTEMRTAGGDADFNFGNPPFTISSGNTDGNGYGNFEYAVPSGYLSLCTANLSEVLG